MSKYRIHSGPVFLWDAESQTVKCCCCYGNCASGYKPV